MVKTFHVIISQDEDGVYTGKVPELKGCLSQGDTLDELMKNIKEAIELCLEVESEHPEKVAEDQIKFIGVQEVEV
ncbi:type II toxin-antitoxin system HicB family antitoxin [Candidatus Woesearchaeota archaeon]|nr:type II toxin-antitoxin system HicB family antitoxin [Candidatus Woesearchaeota archaeon]